MVQRREGFGFASGMAATGAVMTLLQSGDHVVVTDNTYGGTYRLFERVLRRYQLDFTYVDTSDLAAYEAAFTPRTRLVFLESPTNPVLRLTDLSAACTIAHARARRQFGQAIAKHQAVSSKIVRMKVNAEMARLMTVHEGVESFNVSHQRQ